MYSVIETNIKEQEFHDPYRAYLYFGRLKKNADKKSSIVLLVNGKVISGHNVPTSKTQAQYDVKQQLKELVVLANKNGLYDAADVITALLETSGADK